MRNSAIVFVLLFGAMLMEAHAGTRQMYQPATVVSVTNHEISSTYVGSPTDAPLQPEVYSYDIGIRLDCTVYVVRYETGLDYLPSVFTPHRTINVSPQKHVMYVNLPGAGEERLSIGSRSHVKESSCMTNN